MHLLPKMLAAWACPSLCSFVPSAFNWPLPAAASSRRIVAVAAWLQRSGLGKQMTFPDIGLMPCSPSPRLVLHEGQLAPKPHLDREEEEDGGDEAEVEDEAGDADNGPLSSLFQSAALRSSRPSLRRVASSRRLIRRRLVASFLHSRNMGPGRSIQEIWALGGVSCCPSFGGIVSRPQS